jgi:hypothetical protein
MSCPQQTLFGLPYARAKRLDKNPERVSNRIRQKARVLRPGQSTAFSNNWDARILSDNKQASPGSDHYTSLGSFTIQSAGTVSVSNNANGKFRIGPGEKRCAAPLQLQ